MTLINFTVHYDLFSTETDRAGSGSDADQVPLTGPVSFTPVFADERAVVAPDYSPRPSGFKMRSIAGYLDSDGRLKNEPGGTVGVRLPANDPVLELDSLVYRVAFNVKSTVTGQPVEVGGGFFVAPVDDRSVQLADVLQNTDSVGAPRLISGTFDDGTVTFINEDGSVLEPITIPDGTLVWVDNGDSTWSVGS